MNNRAGFTLKEIADAVKGKLYNAGRDENETIVYGVTRSSLDLKPGNLFAAIVANRDGHTFINDAIKAGCSAVLISDASVLPLPVPAVLVEDTVKAYGLIAHYYRKRQNFKVVAVTGSVGKTSTREIVATALRSGLKVYSTPSNQNNELGLPNTILDAPSDTDVLVLEMGMRLLGEIDYLTRIAEPDVALITNIGCSHIERLGSRDNILKAKTEILNGMKSGSLLIINGDDSYLERFVETHSGSNDGIRVASVSTENKQITELCFSACNTSIRDDGSGTEFDLVAKGVNVDRIFIPVCGVCHARNALFAMLASYELGLDLNAVKNALSAYEVLPGRGNLIKSGKYTIIDDAYNASYESMKAAFENMNVISSSRKYNHTILVLGCVLELGDFAGSIHHDIGYELSKYEFDYILVTGDNSQDIYSGYIDGTEEQGKNYKDRIIVTESTDVMKEELKKFIGQNDLILFKGSNAFGLQKMAKEFVEEGNS
ncbi:MAG: UDP-N-acetylmuramoyl-tripeptide--D-alanyl-D-alanine ligase [Clostridia bacterium]|nr:UDP-N-acetylmuramoyl-tripeptide--D-alanyl-D-alanine ligase [Clostridia bacterium]